MHMHSKFGRPADSKSSKALILLFISLKEEQSQRATNHQHDAGNEHYLGRAASKLRNPATSSVTSHCTREDKIPCFLPATPIRRSAVDILMKPPKLPSNPGINTLFLPTNPSLNPRLGGDVGGSSEIIQLAKGHLCLAYESGDPWIGDSGVRVGFRASDYDLGLTASSVRTMLLGCGFRRGGCVQLWCSERLTYCPLPVVNCSGKTSSGPRVQSFLTFCFRLYQPKQPPSLIPSP